MTTAVVEMLTSFLVTHQSADTFILSENQSLEVIDGDTDIAISQLTKAQSGGSLSLLPPLGQLLLCWVEPHDFPMVQQVGDVHTNTNLGDKEKDAFNQHSPFLG